MPFVSKDWRDPGENWVKTIEGWEKLKILAHDGYSDEDYTVSSSSSSESDNETHQNRRSLFHRAETELVTLNRKALEEICSGNRVRRRRSSSSYVGQPHCHITIKCTKEIAGFNGLCDALKRLDFRNAIRDARRFNYICKVLDLLITRKLATLTGGTQKMLFGMLEELALQVSYSEQNLHVLHRLLQNLQKRIEDYLWWGSMLGSVVLWRRQQRRFNQISEIANCIQIHPPDENSKPTIQDIPQECVREIVRRLDNHVDIISASEAYNDIAQISSEQSIWRELCEFHWSRQQLEYIIRTHKEHQVKKDWEKIYHRLRRTYGLSETYANMILLCKNCQCLYWESFGHPCFIESNPEIRKRIETAQGDCLHTTIKVSPKLFLSYFSI